MSFEKCLESFFKTSEIAMSNYDTWRKTKSTSVTQHEWEPGGLAE